MLNANDLWVVSFLFMDKGDQIIMCNDYNRYIVDIYKTW